LLRDSKLCANPPCCPGGRSPRQLLLALLSTCCAPVRLRGRGELGGVRAAEGEGEGSEVAGGGGGATGWLLEETRRGGEGGGAGGGNAAAAPVAAAAAAAVPLPV